MEERYWEQFLTTGKVDDYLKYKGIKVQSGESDNSDRNGSIIRSDR